MFLFIDGVAYSCTSVNRIYFLTKNVPDKTRMTMDPLNPFQSNQTVLYKQIFLCLDYDKYVKEIPLEFAEGYEANERCENFKTKFFENLGKCNMIINTKTGEIVC